MGLLGDSSRGQASTDARLCREQVAGKIEVQMIIRLILILAALGLWAPVATAQTFEQGVDRPGADLRSFAFDGGPGDCQASCAGAPACVAWTFVRPGVQGPQAKCWLKASIQPGNRNDCCVSGVMSGHGPGTAPGPTTIQRVEENGGPAPLVRIEASGSRSSMREEAHRRPERPHGEGEHHHAGPERHGNPSGGGGHGSAPHRDRRHHH